MNKLFKFFLFTFSIQYGICNGQQFNQEMISSEIYKRFPTATIDEKTLLVIDGIPYDQDKYDSIFTQYEESDLCNILNVNSSTLKNNTWMRPDASIILITTKVGNNQKTSRTNFKEIIDKYLDNQSIDQHPALVMDHKLVGPKECTTVLRSLKRKNTECINIIETPVSVENYGNNGKNGLIEIQLKRKPVPNNGEQP